MYILQPNKIFYLSKKFLRAQDGAIAIIFVFLLNILMILTAMCMNLGMSFLAKAELENATTSANLIGARKGASEVLTLSVFKANLPTGPHISYNDEDIQVIINEYNNTASVIPTISVPNFFPVPNTQGSSVSLVRTISSATIPEGNVVRASINLLIGVSSSLEVPNPAGPCPINYWTPCSLLDAVRDSTTQLVANISGSSTDYAVATAIWADDANNNIPYTEDFPQLITHFNNGLQPPIATTNADGYSAMSFANSILSQAPYPRRLIFISVSEDINTLPVGYTPPAGYPPEYNGVPLSDNHRALAWMCNEIKNSYPEEASIWTVPYGPNAHSQMNIDTLKYCATNQDQYLPAHDGDDFWAAINAMYVQSGSLRLVE